MDKKNPYVEIEEDILQFWRENNIFERSVEGRDEKDSYVFYDGPPFATGLPHYGHILSSVIKDLIPRYQTMKGKRVSRRWGWDCHGLPIETLVEKKLSISGKKQIEEKGVDLFNQTARSMVLEYANAWEGMVERIGRWVEFKNSYKTMDTTFMESVWWALKNLWDKKFIYEGRKVLMYCPRCETPVSNAEIQMDNSYREVEEESVYVKFKLKPGQKFKDYETKDSAYMLAWTTTPWTLPANVALAVGRDIDYSAIRIKGQEGLYILASALVEKVFSGQEVEIVHRDLKGSDLEGLYYEPLFEIPAVLDSGKKAWYVATADFVTTEDGTGIVHTAVIYGEDDFALGMDLDLPQVPLLDSKAHYNCDAPEFIQGQYIKGAEKKIIEDLRERGLLFKTEPFKHTYPFCWRCDSPLIYNAISAWFIDILNNKQRLISENEKINWYPENLKHGRFLNILKTAPDWNISRNRYWATPLPFWKCANCSKTTCVGSVKELRDLSDNFSEVYNDFAGEEIINNDSKIDLHKPYIDKIKIKCDCGGEMSRVDEVVDCWVESASMPFAQWHYPFENKAEFEAKYPGQFIGEYIAQTRAWFYYMHAMGVLLFDNISFENVVATGTILNEKGEKLSKSKNNFVDPNIIIEQYGSDALRFYLMSSVVMQADNLFFNEKDLRDIYNKVINLTHNIIKFYDIYAPKDQEIEFSQNRENLGALDRWVISRLESSYQTFINELDQYNTVKAGRVTKDLIDDISTWWLRRSRDRFKDDENNEALGLLRYLLRVLSQMLAPFTPFVSEYAWQKIKNQADAQSVHLSEYPEGDSSSIDRDLEEEMSVARAIVEIVHGIRGANAIKVRQPLRSVSWNYKFKNTDIEQIILDELNVLKAVDEKEIIDPVKVTKDDLSVVLDVNLDEELLEMGDVREFSRAIQDFRKKEGMKAGEKISILAHSESTKFADFLGKNKEQIERATDTSKIEIIGDKGDLNWRDVTLSVGSVAISIGEKNIK